MLGRAKLAQGCRSGRVLVLLLGADDARRPTSLKATSGSPGLRGKEMLMSLGPSKVTGGHRMMPADWQTIFSRSASRIVSVRSRPDAAKIISRTTQR